MRKTLCAKRIVSLLILVAMIMVNTTAFAAWWATPGYEWALKNKLTTVKSKSQLNRNVSLSDFYSTVIKYLELKGIAPRNETIHHEDDMDGIDNIAKGIFEIINGYNTRESLTIQQYYIVENYADHAKKTLEDYMEYSQYLTTDSLKNIQLYLDLSKYKAATLIGSRGDREYILSKLGGNIKNARIIDYNILPYAGEITREEFLVVMYDLISANEISADETITLFNNAGVLVGFDTGLELDKRITYSEMYTFLYRFEIFDFGSSSGGFIESNMDFSFDFSSIPNSELYSEIMSEAFGLVAKGEENITEDDVESLLDKIIEYVGEENVPDGYKEEMLQHFRNGTLEDFTREMITGTK